MEKANHLFDHGTVIFLRLETLARAETLPDVIIEADRYFLPGDDVIVDQVAAAPDRKYLMDYLQGFPQIVYFRERPEIAGAVVNDLASQ